MESPDPLPYLPGRRGGGTPGRRGGNSPYGDRAAWKNWTTAQKRELANIAMQITLSICAESEFSWVQIYGHARSKRLDAMRRHVIQQVLRQTGAPPAIVARVFNRDRTTVLAAARGGKSKKVQLPPR